MPEKYTSEETKTLKTGLYAGLAVVLLCAFFILRGSGAAQTENGRYYEVNARFGRTDGLLVGDKVRLAGMDIGRVVNAQLDDHFHAILTLDISEQVKIPDDSSASIVSSGLMGNKYIEIEPGGSPDYLAPGGEFAYTQDAMVLEELIDRIIGIGKANRKNCK
ncbi:MAG: outer membrane lipid asymmetry maintenance protein MlaD [Pseudomonadota bacterium]|nr:outer membrane lipid asymmetry maintenance protein MlaD [Pseudomonadota bacterium]